jgi:hypothetical protein
MTNQELKQQYERCQLMSDPAQWDTLAIEFYRRGYQLNALLCFRNADEIRGCSFSEAFRVDALEEAGL